jgi:hypothetical protein
MKLHHLFFTGIWLLAGGWVQAQGDLPNHWTVLPSLSNFVEIADCQHAAAADSLNFFVVGGATYDNIPGFLVGTHDGGRNWFMPIRTDTVHFDRVCPISPTRTQMWAWHWGDMDSNEPDTVYCALWEWEAPELHGRELMRFYASWKRRTCFRAGRAC